MFLVTLIRHRNYANKFGSVTLTIKKFISLDNDNFWESVLRPSLKTYKLLHGNLLVPIKFIVPFNEPWNEEAYGLKLGISVSRIRNDKIYRSKKKELLMLGFDYRSLEERRWNDIVHPALTRYKEINGDLLVPALFKVPTTDDWPELLHGYKLGLLVTNIRFRLDYISKHQILKDMGFIFESIEDYNWNNIFYPALTRYKEINGDFLVPQLFKVPSTDDWPESLHGYNLGQLVDHIRNQSAYESKHQILKNMGFIFESVDDYKWNNIVYPALKRYKEINGDLLVPVNFKVPSTDNWPESLHGYKLGQLVHDIRSKLVYESKHQILKDMGFIFESIYDYKWNNIVYPALTRYIEINGDLLVPKSFKVPTTDDWPESLHGYNLGQLVSIIRSRSAYESKHQILKDMGFIFESIEDYKWNNIIYPSLTRYKEINGDLLVPYSFEVPTTDDWPESLHGYKLGYSVNSIRYQSAYKSKYQILKDMGFIFENA